MKKLAITLFALPLFLVAQEGELDIKRLELDEATPEGPDVTLETEALPSVQIPEGTGKVKRSEPAPTPTPAPAPASAQTPESIKNLSAEDRKKLQKLISEAGIYVQGIRLQEALANLAEAEDMAPDLHVIYNLRGSVYTKLRDFEKARAGFAKALELRPGAFEVSFNLAELDFVEGSYEQGEKSFAALLEKYPDVHADTTKLMEFKVCVCKIKQGQMDQATAYIGEHFDFMGDSPAYYFGNAAIAYQNEDEADAQMWIGSARKIYSKGQINIFMDTLIEAGWVETL